MCCGCSMCRDSESLTADQTRAGLSTRVGPFQSPPHKVSSDQLYHWNAPGVCLTQRLRAAHHIPSAEQNGKVASTCVGSVTVVSHLYQHSVFTLRSTRSARMFPVLTCGATWCSRSSQRVPSFLPSCIQRFGDTDSQCRPRTGARCHMHVCVGPCDQRTEPPTRVRPSALAPAPACSWLSPEPPAASPSSTQHPASSSPASWPTGGPSTRCSSSRPWSWVWISVP